ncbi:MAG TPA: glycosyltransferase family 4 protein [Candidatus Saccharimonadales bacterium]|nr:glycosyltransferase family 4 protein [Candidatus Saccharimonadales bacterium]
MKKTQSAPLKVSFVFDDSLDSFDGVANQVKLLGGWLSERGHEVSYMVGQTKMASWAGGKVYSLAKNVRVNFNANKMSIPLPAKRRNVLQTLSETQPDVLHVQLPHSPFMAQRVINAADKNVAVVGTFHVYPANRPARAGAKLLSPAYLGGLSRFDEIVSVSPAAAEFARRAFGLETKIIPNAVDVQLFKSDVANQPARVVFLGRLVNRKGAGQLIKAFAHVIKFIPNANLVIAGTGPKRQELETLSKKLGLAENVEFKGFIDEADKAGLLASAEIACFPSFGGESFGIVLIEAMAAGSGVIIGGDNPGYRTVLGAQPELLFDPDNTERLAKLIVKLMSDSKLRQDLHAWQDNEIHKYDVDEVGRQVEALYVRAIAKAGRTRHN